jgi:iron(III) transport system permease protein
MPRFARISVVGTTILILMVPVALILYQSLLSGPFYAANAVFSLEAFEIVFGDPRFWNSIGNTLIICLGMVVIAVPLGAALAFLVVRTDMPGKGWLEPIILTPMFISAIVLAFGYVVVLGPVGFFTLFYKTYVGEPFWFLYSKEMIIFLCGLNHIPHVYLYVAAALRNLGSDVEEAARVAGAGPLRVALGVSLPMVRPAMLYATILVLFMGFEQFGFPLVLGDPQGISVITTYLYSLAQQFGVPKYQVLAVVAVFIIAVTLPLVAIQRQFLKASERYVSVKGKGSAQRVIALGRVRWLAISLVLVWLVLAVLFPVGGIVLRSFLSAWGVGIGLLESLTLANFRDIFVLPSLQRGAINSLLIATLGAAAAVAVFALIGLAVHRWKSRWERALDYSILMPRAMPGLIIGLAVFWVFLFIPLLTPLRQTLFAIWIAYMIVWIGYGIRLINGSLLQISPDLEEAARVTGASAGRTSLDVTLPLMRSGLVAAWVLLYIAFVREYSTAVYLFAPGTEVLGSLMITLWSTGGINQIAALSTINIALVAAGVLVALRIGKIHA